MILQHCRQGLVAKSGICKDTVRIQPVPALLLVEARDVDTGSPPRLFAASRTAAWLLSVASPRRGLCCVLPASAWSLFQLNSCTGLVVSHFGVPLVYRLNTARTTLDNFPSWGVLGATTPRML